MLFFVQCAYMKLRPAPETVIRVRWDAEKRDAYCGRLRLAAARAKESPMPATPSSQLVIVVDFGAQYGQLIARRVRDWHAVSYTHLDVYKRQVPAAGRRARSSCPRCCRDRPAW